MKHTDKRGILPNLNRTDTVIIELGCGNQKKFSNSIGIDITDSDCVDIICDLRDGLDFLPDNSVDMVYSSHLLEHLPDLGFFMKEVYRILKKGGKLSGTVPHFSNPYYFSDYTHKTPMGLYTFCYFAESTPFRRKVLRYDTSINFRINRLKIVFYSPFKIVNIFRKIHGMIFNSALFMQEFYEGSLSTGIPAHELSFELEKI